MSEVLEQFEKFVCKVGHVGDIDFKELTSLLEHFPVIEELEPVGDRVNYVETIYDIDGKYYKLWYQVKTPRTPEGFDFLFGFDTNH